MELLLISNGFYKSDNYLEYARGWVSDHFGASPEKPKTLFFVPYAKKDGDAYVKEAAAALAPVGIQLLSAHTSQDPVSLFQNSKVDGVFIPGGNTYRLLDELQKTGLLPAIREKVMPGMPYMGVSAGTNVAAPTIMTTNDLPSRWPRTPDSFGFIPFQINPHYVEGELYHVRKGEFVRYNGETREERIAQFHGEEGNDRPVLGLQEGTALRIRGPLIELLGDAAATLFVKGEPPVAIGKDQISRILALRPNNGMAGDRRPLIL